MEAKEINENCKKKKRCGGRNVSLLLVERFGMQGNDMQPENKDQAQTMDHLQGVCIGLHALPTELLSCIGKTF